MPLPQSVPGPQRADRAERIPDAEWEKHRDTIKSWYIDHGMRLEDLIQRMKDNFGFTARFVPLAVTEQPTTGNIYQGRVRGGNVGLIIRSDQQYKTQFTRWNFRKNKRRLDQRAASPETDHPRRPHQRLRTNDYPQFVTADSQLGDPRSISLAAMGTGVPPSFVPAFGPDPFSMPAANLNPNLLNFPPYGAQYTPGNVQLFQPFMYGNQFQQPNPQSSSQVPQDHFQLNYNIVDGGPSQTPTRQSSSRINTTAAHPARLPIHQAVQSGSLRGTELLLRAKPECAHAIGKKGIGPAWIAAQGGYIGILKLLITHKVDLNLPSQEHNRFPIHQAAQAGHTEVVRLLLENGAEPDPVDHYGITPLWSAAQGGHHEIIEMLLSHGSRVGKEIKIEIESTEGGRRPIHQAAQGGYLQTVKLLRAKGANCDPVDGDGITPLWSASQNGHADVVRELINAGALLDVMPYKESRLPIHQAAQGGHLEVIQTLLEFGASLTPEANAFDDSEPSPFLLACNCDNPDLVRLFLDRGVDIGTTAKNKKTALHFAAHRGHLKVGQLLIDRGCDVDAREVDGWPVLMLAAQEGHLPFVNLLIDNHVNVNAEEKDGATALWIASQQGHANIVRRLLEAGARQLPTNGGGCRPIHRAAENGHLACVKLLLEHSPGEIDVAGHEGCTALTMASHKNEPSHLAIMRYLVSKGAQVM